MDLDMSSCTAEDEAIVSTYVKLAKLRQWIFPPLDTNGYTTSMYIASLFGVKTEGDALLVSRMVCVNPEWAERQTNWGVLRQGEGDVILTDHAHAVFGMSFLNMAWNVFFPSYAQTYVQRAVQVNDMMRQRNADDVKERWDNRGIQRSLSLSTCIINCALRGDAEGCVCCMVYDAFDSSITERISHFRIVSFLCMKKNAQTVVRPVSEEGRARPPRVGTCQQSRSLVREVVQGSEHRHGRSERLRIQVLRRLQRASGERRLHVRQRRKK